MENTIEKKLQALEKLQEIDSNLDGIKKVRGALPEEVRDLEDEIAGYNTRLEKFNDDLKGIEDDITNKKTSIKDSEKLIKKYNEQQMNVRNNREYDAITKEMELQTLEIQISEKRIKEAFIKIEAKKEEIKETEVQAGERKKDLKVKHEELKQIISESEGDENKLLDKRKKATKDVDDRLLVAYDKLRGNARNGLAVVSVKRAACGGCFNIVPPQRQADIKERKKIIVCEHCGRIFSDVEFVIEKEKPKRTRRTTVKKKKKV